MHPRLESKHPGRCMSERQTPSKTVIMICGKRQAASSCGIRRHVQRGQHGGLSNSDAIVAMKPWPQLQLESMEAVRGHEQGPFILACYARLI